MDNTELRYERTHTAIGQAVTERLHGGYAATRRTDGDLAKKIQRTLALLELVPLDWRDELWAAAHGGATHASELLAAGRRAKAGVVHARTRRIINQPN